MNMTFRQSYTTCDVQREYKTPCINTFMFYGSSDDSGNFFADAIRDMQPTFDLFVHYMFGAYQITEGATVASRNPYWTPGYQAMSRTNPNFTRVTMYNPENTSPTSASSWRCITTSVSYRDVPLSAHGELVLAPFSEASTYVYDYGDAVSAMSVYDLCGNPNPI